MELSCRTVDVAYTTAVAAPKNGSTLKDVEDELLVCWQVKAFSREAGGGFAVKFRTPMDSEQADDLRGQLSHTVLSDLN